MKNKKRSADLIFCEVTDLFYDTACVMDFSAFEADTDLPGAEDGRAVSALFFVPVRISYLSEKKQETKAFKH